MDQNRRMSELFDDALSGTLDRRTVLRRGLALGLSIPAMGALLAACGDDDEDETPAATTGTGGAATTGTGGAGASPTMASGGTPATGGSPMTGSPTTDGGTLPPMSEWAVDRPPEPSAEIIEAASAFAGTKLVYWGDSVGPGQEAGVAQAAAFAAATGIEVEHVARPQSATESLAQYQRLFQAKDAGMDCGMIDVIWPAQIAQHLADLTDALGDDAGRYFESIIQNNTVDGKLVGIPWYYDFGMLYYRTDLLEKYGFSAPPATWDELEEQARTIQEGERAEFPDFWGYVFQGNAYEGLTCNALEWIYSHGGGTIVDADGNVTLDNEEAVAALNRAQGWVGDIAPQGVTSYTEEESRNVFQGGNAAFCRQWPYVYGGASVDDSPIKGMFHVAPLPAVEGQPHGSTVGGWQLAVSNYSENKEAATLLIRYLASPESLKWRATYFTFNPPMAEVAADPEVIENLPFLQIANDVDLVVRPSLGAAENYNEVSTEFFQSCNEILNGEDAADILPDTAEAIAALL